MLIRVVQERLSTQTHLLLPIIVASCSLPSINFSQPSAFSSHFTLLLPAQTSAGLLINHHPLFGDIESLQHPSLCSVTCCQLRRNPPGDHKRPTKMSIPVFSHLPFITLSFLIVLFRDMPPHTFPKFLEIWLHEPAPRARNATTACVQREASVCTRIHTHTPRGSCECPVIRLCFDLDTHREESTNDYAHAGGCSLYPGMFTKDILFSCVPSDLPADPYTHFTHSSHTSASGCHKS